MWWLWTSLGFALGWLLISFGCTLLLAWLLSGAPEQTPHRTGGKPWET